MIVEDEPMTRRLYAEILGRVAKPLPVGTFADAVAVLPELDCCDVILADNRLPDGNGLDLLCLAKARGIGGVLITADANQELTKQASDGGWIVLQKPVPTEYLRVFIEHMLSVASAVEAARRLTAQDSQDPQE